MNPKKLSGNLRQRKFRSKSPNLNTTISTKIINFKVQKKFLISTKLADKILLSLNKNHVPNGRLSWLSYSIQGRKVLSNLYTAVEGQDLLRWFMTNVQGQKAIESLAFLENGQKSLRFLSGSREGRKILKRMCSSSEGRRILLNLFSSPEYRRILRNITNSPRGLSILINGDLPTIKSIIRNQIKNLKKN
ncbi:MAG: hypothetical protein PHY04_00575 [Candidatus ainarchaeum sp.]|jgi:hypothetical protein|nr:hypothetical protein [Candidatus ainarchaeum sp.]